MLFRVLAAEEKKKTPGEIYTLPQGNLRSAYFDSKKRWKATKSVKTCKKDRKLRSGPCFSSNTYSCT